MPNTDSESKLNERKRKGIKAIVEGKMEDYGATKRTAYSIIGIVGCLVVTVVMSITGMGFDPSVFRTWNYWTGLIIQYAIAIFAMITGRQMGDDTQRNKPDGQYRKELKTYKGHYERVDAMGYITYFDAWLTIYKDKLLKKRIMDVLADFGIRQVQVLDLDISDVPSLAKPFTKDWTGTPFEDKYRNPETGESKTVFLSLNEVQREALSGILQGLVKVEHISPSYFLNALKGTSTDGWRQAAKADKKIGAKLLTSYTYKLLMILAISLVTNGLIPDPYESGDAVALNIATRIFTLLSATIWGIYTGFKIVEMDIIFLAYKSYILQLYADESEKGVFKPETVEQQAQREFDEYQQRQREAVDSVVTPEVITGAEPPMIGGGNNG